MKRYIKPCVDIYDATMTLPLMLSLHDEVGSGQLTNEMNFDEEEYTFSVKSLWEEKATE